MRQVPANRHASPGEAAPGVHYLILGDGRLARHLRAYLTLEKLSFETWSRRDGTSLLALAERATHVLFAISDRAIDEVYESLPIFSSRSCVHFSGASVSAKMPSAHPLMTFGPTLYSLDEYRAIPFVCEKDRASFADLLPGLTNPSFAIEANRKPLYHALCAMTGNFTVLLWEKAFASFSQELGLPVEVLHPFLIQTARNLVGEQKGETVLTGPLARGDFATITRHLDALGADPYANVYRSFVDAFLKSEERKPLPLGGLA